MKKLILAAAVMAAFSASVAQAEEANSLTFNASVVSDYRYRGISQTHRDLALQGGADYTNNPTGLYAGTWLSTIKWIKDAGGDADMEWDIYGGKRGNITDSLSYDVGLLGYLYPSNSLPTSANTAEVYGQLGFGPAYAKYSYALTNLFGFVDSKRSGYLDVGANIDVSKGFTVNLHAGHQNVKGAANGNASYTDWKLGLTKDLGVASGSIAVIGTNADKAAYTVNNTFNGRTALVLSLSKTF